MRCRTDPAGGQSVAALPRGRAIEPHGVLLSGVCAQNQESPRGLPSVSASSPAISSHFALRPAPDVPGGYLRSVYAAVRKTVSPVRATHAAGEPVGGASGMAPLQASVVRLNVWLCGRTS